MIDFQVIASGSTGNAVVLEKGVMIDCGVAFKRLRDIYQNLKLVLLTHIHKDHFRVDTIQRLAFERPTLRFACPDWLVQPLAACEVARKNIDVLEIGVKYDYGLFQVKPVKLVHNVPNCGYKLYFNAGKAIYATDTSSMNGITAQNYDLYMIEANYSEQEITKRIKNKLENGGYIYEYRVLDSHLSREKCNDWLYSNMGADSRYVYMHEHVENTKKG